MAAYSNACSVYDNRVGIIVVIAVALLAVNVFLIVSLLLNAFGPNLLVLFVVEFFLLVRGAIIGCRLCGTVNSLTVNGSLDNGISITFCIPFICFGMFSMIVRI